MLSADHRAQHTGPRDLQRVGDTMRGPVETAGERPEVPLFDGVSLSGWRAVPRLPVAAWPGGPEPDVRSSAYQRAAGSVGRWNVENGMIVGGQEPPGSGLGAYLVSEATFADFELTLEAWPDWPADSGVMVRATGVGAQGFQVLLDHRRSGAIGGFYGNGIGGFHAIAHAYDARRDASGAPVGLVEELPSTTLEPLTEDKKQLLSFAASPESFLSVWRWDDWNEIKVRCTGTYPRLTTWVNGLKLYELDTATMVAPHYDREAVARLLGRAGHIALEVHDNDAGMGTDRWGVDSVVRWRNIRVRELATD
jgi:Domain of Unknown Function (DUF1080)